MILKSDTTLWRIWAYTAMWGGWLGLIGIATYSTLTYDPAKGQFAPPWITWGALILLGLAIAGTSLVSRLKLSDAIVEAFKTGMQAARNAELDRKSHEHDN